MSIVHAPVTRCPGRQLVLARVVDAPRELVFKLWTDPAHMAQWWGPKGFTNPVCELDARPGGALRVVMRAPDGAEYPMGGFFRNVVEPEGLVFVSEAEDAEGKPLLEGITIVAFADYGDRTKVTVQASAAALAPEAVRMLEGMEQGWAQSLERLAELATRLNDNPHRS